MKPAFHAKSIAQSLHELGTDPQQGLPMQEAESRLSTYGKNKLQSTKKKSLIRRILAQFKDFLVIILLVAAVISVFAGDGLKDAILIFGILLVNVIISITQENRADNALAELKNMSSPKAKVKRSGTIEKIDSENLVPGDIIIIDAGDYIPADIRIIESINLKIDESALTGESMPVTKKADTVLDAAASLGDRVNLASMGTVVTYGRGVGLVYATGMETQMGKIAAVLNQAPEASTPLQDKLNAMAKVLGIICIVTCVLIFGIGLLYGMDIVEMFMVAVSLAVAAVPEGVAIVATVILAIGVQKMVKKGAIVKRLRAVETLGSTTVICSDKTGTLTQNQMTVVKVMDIENTYSVTGTGYSSDGEIILDTAAEGFEPKTSPSFNNIQHMAEIATLCNDAIFSDNTKIIGDPTEGAMLVFAAKAGINKDTHDIKHKRIQEIPFDSERKLMSTFNKKDGKIIMNTKGAPDAILKRSTKAYDNGKIVPMTEEMRQRLTKQNETFAACALRVLAVAYKEHDSEHDSDNIDFTMADISETNLTADATENDLTYVGMICMIDPPRKEAQNAIALCQEAGINIKMITGDHKITATAIATSLGLMQQGGETLDGTAIDNLSDEALAKKTKHVNVYARVSPEHKVRIVTAVKSNGNIAAMTGDGVNDAPSLKMADIGIAMGITGTDVSKEAADMVLTDDNFVSIVNAVQEGRTIYSNIRKVTSYLLSCNIGEILIIFLAIVFGLPVPLVATQLLFVNLLTDAFPAFALGMEDKEPNVMKKPPRDPREPIINKIMGRAVAIRAIFLTVGCLGAFLYGLRFYDYITAISMCFFTLVATELLVSFSAKTDARISKSVLNNKFMNISMVLSFGVLIAVMYIPVLNGLFTTVPLGFSQLIVCIGLMLLVVIGSEAVKGR